MKRSDGSVICDRCHLVIAPKAPDRLNYGKTDYHAGCYLSYRREKKPRVHFDEFRAVALILALLWMLVPFAPKDAEAEEVYPQDQWVWGCQVSGRTLSGGCVIRRFTMVGETENDVDTDAPRILGFEPGNVPISRDGKPIFSRIPASTWLRPGEHRIVSASTCSCARR